MLTARTRLLRCSRSRLYNPVYFSTSSRLSFLRQKGSGSHLDSELEEKKPPLEPSDKWNYNRSSLFEPPQTTDPSLLRLVTANDLEPGTKPPRGVKMLARDFIEDSLYNPNYGYFSKNATIFDWSQEPLDFTKIRNNVEFDVVVAERYATYEADKQLWHTPTELFKVRLYRLLIP